MERYLFGIVDLLAVHNKSSLLGLEMAKKRKSGIPGLSFSWKRALGISSYKAQISRGLGVPLTRQGRQRKFGKMAGCLLPLMIAILIFAAITVVSCLNNNSSTISPKSNLPRIEPTGNPTHDMLMAKSEQMRLTVFSQLLAEEGCNADRLMFQGLSKDKLAFWSVGCSNGRDFQIMIYADEKGTNRGTPCSVLKAVGVKCWEKY
jgi:hypothetical protein